MRNGSRVPPEVCDLDCKRQAVSSFDVVRKDHGGRVRAGPEPAKVGLALASREQEAVGIEAQQVRHARVGGPARELREALAPDEHPSRPDLKPPRDESLHAVEGIQLA